MKYISIILLFISLNCYSQNYEIYKKTMQYKAKVDDNKLGIGFSVFTGIITTGILLNNSRKDLVMYNGIFFCGLSLGCIFSYKKNNNNYQLRVRWSTDIH